VYCNTGTEASHAYFALKHLLGYPKVLVYVPSWTEWSEKSEWPVESGVAATANGTAPAAAAGGRSCSDQ
jgi:3-mercaptopyruvate sulfurtransferase SseA